MDSSFGGLLHFFSVGCTKWFTLVFLPYIERNTKLNRIIYARAADKPYRQNVLHEYENLEVALIE